VCFPYSQEQRGWWPVTSKDISRQEKGKKHVFDVWVLVTIIFGSCSQILTIRTPLFVPSLDEFQLYSNQT
jgi:hypothetical protein